MLTDEQDIWSTNQYSLEFWFTQQIVRSPLKVISCESADLVYVPLTTLWAPCDHEDVQAKIAEFTADVKMHLPLLETKPHFMVLPRVHFYSGLDLQRFKDVGLTFITIEGDLGPHFVEVPYPSYYHHHDGLASNRFIQKAVQSKDLLAFECFGTTKHVNEAVNIRKALQAACLLAGSDCVHVSPDYTGEQAASAALQYYVNASNAWFCMQPIGDTPTRRSTFDCLLAGSIPVFLDQSSMDHFPWSDLLNASELILVHPGVMVADIFSHWLPAVPLKERQARLKKIAQVAHVFQYSLTPHSGLIRWDNIDVLEKWDDAFTFSMKALLRNLKKRFLL